MERLRSSTFIACTVAIVVSCYAAAAWAATDSHLSFESHAFRPVTISPSGRSLFVANVPSHRIEIFLLDDQGRPTWTSSVRVGFEPVAVAARSDTEVWVANHVSDSVSVVSFHRKRWKVIDTLVVGDEPNDIVFAGPGNSLAFVTAAHRGQSSPYTNPENPGELVSPGVPRTDVWVFDATTPTGSTSRTPLKVLQLFGDTAGPLAASDDGKRVYVGVFKSGNRTTIVPRTLVCAGGTTADPCTLAKSGHASPGGTLPPDTPPEQTATHVAE